METVSRKVYYRDENFSLEFEKFEGDLLLHCTVNKFTPSIAKQGYLVFGTLLNECRYAGIKRVFAVLVYHKFAKMYGGTKVNEFEYLGKKYEVIEWETQ